MNILEQSTIRSPSGKDDVCAVTIIDTPNEPFVLHGIAEEGQEYTLSFYARSESSGGISVANNAMAVGADWKRYVVTFVADDVDLPIYFTATGTYYLYNTQLEVGNKDTDFALNPADTEQSLDDLTVVVNNHSTQFSIMDGQISALIAEDATIRGEYDALVSRTTAIEANLDGITSRVTLTEADISGVDRRLTEAESTIVQQAGEISLKVSKGDIISTINQSAEEVKINAAKIMLEGATIADSFTATNLHITGNSVFDGMLNGATGSFSGRITATSGMIGFLHIEDSFLTSDTNDSGEYVSISSSSFYLNSSTATGRKMRTLISGGYIDISYADGRTGDTDILITPEEVYLGYRTSDGDYYNRARLFVEDGSGKLALTASNGSKTSLTPSQNGGIISDSWLRTTGATGWYSETYGGGWYMSDTFWIRTYGSKSVYTPGTFQCDGGFKAGNRATSWINALKGTAAIDVPNAGASTSFNALASVKATNGAWVLGSLQSSNDFYIAYGNETRLNNNTNGTDLTFVFGVNGRFSINNGGLYSRDGVNLEDGLYRKPTGSSNVDGNKCAVLKTNVNSSGTYYFTLSGQWGTAGADFTNKTFTATTSDIRLKDNIVDSKINALEVINQIKIREFDWKNSGVHQRIGFVADELELLDSGLSIGGGWDEDGNIDAKGVNEFYLVGYLTKGIQELHTTQLTQADALLTLESRQDDQKVMIEYLLDENAALKKRVKELEKSIA